MGTMVEIALVYQTTCRFANFSSWLSVAAGIVENTSPALGVGGSGDQSCSPSDALLEPSEGSGLGRDGTGGTSFFGTGFGREGTGRTSFFGTCFGRDGIGVLFFGLVGGDEGTDLNAAGVEVGFGVSFLLAVAGTTAGGEVEVGTGS